MEQDLLHYIMYIVFPAVSSAFAYFGRFMINKVNSLEEKVNSNLKNAIGEADVRKLLADKLETIEAKTSFLKEDIQEIKIKLDGIYNILLKNGTDIK